VPPLLASWPLQQIRMLHQLKLIAPKPSPALMLDERQATAASAVRDRTRGHTHELGGHAEAQSLVLFVPEECDPPDEGFMSLRRPTRG
jgi:hypothetical protein